MSGNTAAVARLGRGRRAAGAGGAYTHPPAPRCPEFVMTEQPHVTIEFVGGPFCGAVVDSREHSLRAGVVRRLLAAARSERSAELRLRKVCARRVRVAVGRVSGGNVGQQMFHRYRLLVELGFGSRVLFRGDYAGVATA